MTPIAHLSEKSFLALNALATYRYLTAKQLVDLKIATSPADARDQVFAKLVKGRKPLVKVHNPGRYIGYGQLPYIFYLTSEGTEVLAEYHRIPKERIIYPKGGIQFQRDIFHRMKVIDCHINFRQWAENQGIKLSIADMYFDKVGSQKRGGQVSRARVDLKDGSYIEPDAIFGFKYKRQGFLYVLEYHRCTDSKRIEQQLAKHRRARQEYAVGRKYGLEETHLILSIREPQKTNQECDSQRSGR